MHTHPEDVLQFWLGAPATTATDLRWKIRRWFLGGPALDAAIRTRFGAAVEAAERGLLDDWADTPRGLLALVVLLDQFTRNLYRGDPRTFASDGRARELTRRALDRGDSHEIEAFTFLHMPLGHSEDLADQDLHVDLARQAVERAPLWARPVWEAGVAMATQKRALIAEFGRFPHRNAVLGRATTEAERAALERPPTPPEGLRPPVWRIETTERCGRTPMLRAVLGHLGVPWVEEVVPPGTLLARYGAPGPVVHEGDTTLLDLTAVVALAEHRAGTGPADEAGRAARIEWIRLAIESLPRSAFLYATAVEQGQTPPILEQLLLSDLGRLDARLADSPFIFGTESAIDQVRPTVRGLAAWTGLGLDRWPSVARWVSEGPMNVASHPG